MIDEQSARDFYNAAGGRYPRVDGAALVPPLAPAPAGGEAKPAQGVPGQPDAVARAVEAQDALQAVEDKAASFYAPVLTRGLVDWSEPAAQAAEYDLQAPPGVLDASDEGRAALGRLREGLAEAGAGPTLARELFGDAIRAHQEGRPVASRERAEAELRSHFGARYDAEVAAARGLVQRAAAKCPDIIPFLERTGLGNDPTFIRKLAARAARARS